jgi:peptide deformylase
MAVLEILRYPDERLKREAEEVTVFDEELRSFVADLEETMRTGPGGVGIAATQVNRLQQIIIVDVSTLKNPVPNHGRLILINPVITKWDGMEVGREGCMSVPDYTGNVIRAEHINVRARNLQGKELVYQCEGFEARAIQHEMDHLEGVLFLDRLVSRKKDLFKRKVYQ